MVIQKGAWSFCEYMQKAHQVIVAFSLEVEN